MSLLQLITLVFLVVVVVVFWQIVYLNLTLLLHITHAKKHENNQNQGLK